MNTPRFTVSLFVLTALNVSACGSDDDKFTDCHFGDGSLGGTWRTHYVETDGNCGPISDETSVLDTNTPPQPGCTQTTNTISSDKCRADLAWSCPTTDGNGTQSWVVVLTQTGPETIKGTGTVQLNHPTAGTCRSTYAMTLTKL